MTARACHDPLRRRSARFAGDIPLLPGRCRMKRAAMLGLVCALLGCDGGIIDDDGLDRPAVRGSYRLTGIDGVLPQTLVSRDGKETYTVHHSQLQVMNFGEYAVTVEHTAERSGERRTLTVGAHWLWSDGDLWFEPWNDGCVDEGRWHDDERTIELVADCSYGRQWVYQRWP